MESLYAEGVPHRAYGCDLMVLVVKDDFYGKQWLSTY